MFDCRSSDAFVARITSRKWVWTLKTYQRTRGGIDGVERIATDGFVGEYLLHVESERGFRGGRFAEIRS